MLPTNVMSFMKKMVTTQPDTTSADTVTPEDTGTTFSKLRQLMTVTGNVAKPTKITPVEDVVVKEEVTAAEPPKPKPEPGRPPSRSGACRVCLKSFKPDDFARTCCECQFKVCEDCASYSEAQNYEDSSTWRCSVCRRRIASRGQPIVTQESTDSLLEVPVLEALQRRHSDARLSCQAGLQTPGLGSGLAPPRSPELRRHSDVSPASLKELEKVAGERREELRWEKELERRSKSRGGSPDRHQGRSASPPRASKISATDQDTGDIGDDEDERRRRAARRTGTVRRKSRVTKQHSYDEESSCGGGGQSGHADTGLGLPVLLPRRASAYDVYATPGSGGLNAVAIAAAQQRASISNQGSRDPEDRSPGRRPSFRAVKPVMAYDMAGDEEKIINLDASAGSEGTVVQSDEPRESRPRTRRASMLPDINLVRSLPSVPKATPPVVARVAAEDRELPRQGSLADGEGIKIVIHDVDSDLAPRVNAKRRVVLRKDPMLIEKGHRTRGFGMRVLGGKSGTDGRLYASIVWTVPGGPADKAGLLKGDKVLEWSGVSLIDRTFEDVAQIVEHTGDVAEMVVESVADMDNICSGDLLDDAIIPPTGGKTSGNLGLQLDTETDKTPSSPTRRKLPKTPEQIAKERQVTGRIQIQVWYEVDTKELVVSVLGGDELCLRDDTSPPEAFAKLVLLPPCGEKNGLKTDIAEPAQNPIWNANLTFPGIPGEKLIERTIEVTLWDSQPDCENIFLGECVVNLENAIEADRAIWYRLEDPRGWRSGKSPYASPRGSVSAEVSMIAQRLLRRDIRERSYSDDTQTHSESGSPEPYFLHPDHAWQANSRRGSSQSEQLEIEPYELSKDYSRSLPGSRRSSFQSQGGTDSKRGSIGDSETPPVYYSRDRRRSSVARTARNHEEVLKSLQKIAARGELGRTMSLSSEKRRGSRRDERRDSINRGERKDSVGQTMMGFPERFYDRNSESDEDDKWSESKKENGVDIKLGPGQVAPKGFKHTGAMGNGEVQLALFLSKGTLEVEVIAARDVCPGEREEPDTYVKTYLRDGERWLHKRKTRVVRHSRNPQYRQTLKYGSCDALGRNILVMLWEKKQGFESNQGLGGAEVNLEQLSLTKLSVGWYPLFPIHTLGNHNADSP
ncbi:regulating synaptic membrane exocytosis protein 1 isoform X2 [Fopius arisanus]|uniref:Regulating synaptic membrane exocytosis protein 1 isoform X2 n=1 Tax=Fopius arisanus TaxID=64838 RepID=A0A9R1T1A6_9HYME|nr:PREDICTED: regulating synaptic membrane exocytosis protein 1 isoform X2 [Fopius arisanus]